MMVGTTPLSRLSAPSEAIRQFTPSWFTATMGTGIVALMVGQLAQAVPAVHPLAVALWVLNIVLFTACSLALAARAVFFSETMRPLFTHAAQSMFVGAIPMGLATIINGFIAFGLPLIGPQAVAIALPLWWIDAVLSVLSGFVIPFLMFTSQDHSIDRMSALWLLPIVPAEVTAASAGFVIPHVATAVQPVLLVCATLLWAYSVPAALGILTILFLRMALHRIPPRELGVSGWLTLGPLGTGALAMVTLGGEAARWSVGTPLESVGGAFAAIGIAGGLALWGYGAWWWLLGVATTLHHVRSELPFNMGWWGFTFPLGVYTAATYALAAALHAGVFLDLARAFTVGLFCLWIVVSFRTLRGAYHGDLFHAPCLNCATSSTPTHEQQRVATP